MILDLGNIRFDVYLHDTIDPVQVLLKRIVTQGDHIMAKLDDVNRPPFQVWPATWRISRRRSKC